MDKATEVNTSSQSNKNQFESYDNEVVHNSRQFYKSGIKKTFYKSSFGSKTFYKKKSDDIESNLSEEVTGDNNKSFERSQNFTIKTVPTQLSSHTDITDDSNSQANIIEDETGYPTEKQNQLSGNQYKNKNIYSKKTNSTPKQLVPEEERMSLEEVYSNVSIKQVSHKNRNGVMLYKQFSLRHVFRGGAVIWIKHRGKDYYVVFKSLSRPNRGTQLPGGRVEKKENLADTILREVFEETGIHCRIVCPLGYIYFENPEDNYSNMQTYYIVKPLYKIDVNSRWRFVDKDSSKQTLEIWCEEVGKDPKFLSVGQDSVINMFNNWLEEHKRETPLDGIEN